MPGSSFSLVMVRVPSIDEPESVRTQRLTSHLTDTTSNALACTLFLLADEDPVHQERILEEARQAFAGQAAPTFDARSQLKYTVSMSSDRVT